MAIVDVPRQQQLPALPHILVQLLDAMARDGEDFQQVARVVRQDPAIAARVLAAANSSAFARAGHCATIERALVLLGMDTLKTLVITIAVQQLFGRFGPCDQGFLKTFWRRSLSSASFAHILANLTGYPAPEQAYLTALLSGTGRLLLLAREGYLDLVASADDEQSLLAAERERWGCTHAELAADMLETWGLGGFMADAVRFQHERGEAVQGSHHLIMIVNLAGALARADAPPDAGLQRAEQLFGLQATLVQELRRRVREDVDGLAQAMGIDTDGAADDGRGDPQETLVGRLAELAQASRFSSEIWQAESRSALGQAARRCAYLVLGVEHSLLLVLDPDERQLRAELDADGDGGEVESLVLPVRPGHSAAADAVLENVLIESGKRSEPTVIDRQLMRICRSPQLLCLPLSQGGRTLGVLALGVHEHLPTHGSLQALGRELALHLIRQRERQEGLSSQDSAVAQIEHRVREAVHEASNPLSIIGNYLQMLKLKLEENHQAQEDIEQIRGEIERVNGILRDLKQPDEIGRSVGRLDMNRLVTRLAPIFERSLFEARGLALELQLDEQAPTVAAADAHLRQILTNLVRNAAEALPEGGRVAIRTEAEVRLGPTRYSLVEVVDNGPGIPPEVMERLFSPIASTKGRRHAGLGLSITRRLVDEAGGKIMCRSDKSGTRFQVLLPC